MEMGFVTLIRKGSMDIEWFKVITHDFFIVASSAPTKLVQLTKGRGCRVDELLDHLGRCGFAQAVMNGLGDVRSAIKDRDVLDLRLICRSIVLQLVEYGVRDVPRRNSGQVSFAYTSPSGKHEFRGATGPGTVPSIPLAR